MHFTGEGGIEPPYNLTRVRVKRGELYSNGIPTDRPTLLMVLCSFAFLYGSCSVNANTKSVFVPLFPSPCAELL
jgi:hypothetical protein